MSHNGSGSACLYGWTDSCDVGEAIGTESARNRHGRTGAVVETDWGLRLTEIETFWSPKGLHSGAEVSEEYPLRKDVFGDRVSKLSQVVVAISGARNRGRKVHAALVPHCVNRRPQSRGGI